MLNDLIIRLVGLVLIKGAIPGPKGGLVFVRNTARGV